MTEKQRILIVLRKTVTKINFDFTFTGKRDVRILLDSVVLSLMLQQEISRHWVKVKLRIYLGNQPAKIYETK